MRPRLGKKSSVRNSFNSDKFFLSPYQYDHKVLFWIMLVGGSHTLDSLHFLCIIRTFGQHSQYYPVHSSAVTLFMTVSFPSAMAPRGQRPSYLFISLALSAAPSMAVKYHSE